MAASQRGVVLVVVLVILLAVTLLGTVVMQGATLQTKMVGNSQARQQAFNAAEATLAVAEQFLATTTTISRESLRLKTKFSSDCATSKGLCFVGTIPDAGSTLQQSCTLGAIPNQEIWEDTALKVWETESKHMPIPVPNMKNPGKYIIEFRCFIDGAAKVSANDGDALFRITAQGYSDNGDATVMVQSTYRIYLP